MSTTSLITCHCNIIFTTPYGGGSRPTHHHQWQTSRSSALYRPCNRGSVGGGMPRCSPITISCRGSSDSNSGRGFGQDPLPSPATPTPASKASTTRDSKDMGKGAASPRRKSVSQQPSFTRNNQAPATNSRMDESTKGITFDLEFEERLQAVKRSALDQKKSEEKTTYGAIDYDAPISSEPSKIGLGTKIGVGVAVVVFGLVFALGDFLPSGSVNTNNDAIVSKNTLSPEEKEKLQERLQQYEATLAISPDDPVSREGVAVTLTELGEYTRAASTLEDLSKVKGNDPEVFRLLGEVKFELKDYEGSIAAYKSAMMLNKMDFQVLRGLTNALLAAKKPDEAVKILVTSRESLEREKANQGDTDTQYQMDPIQVDLLLGKAYSDWGHVSDAVSVYERLISSHPDDFRGYLAKGIILKANGKNGDAERMLIQARFFAPEGAKGIVDRYSRQ